MVLPTFGNVRLTADLRFGTDFRTYRKQRSLWLRQSNHACCGVGYGTQRDCLKGTPEAGNKSAVLSVVTTTVSDWVAVPVSSVDTSRYSSGIELECRATCQRRNAKRANNVVRALCEEEVNPVVSIHDHGSAGHVNCLSELVEECGGLIDMSKLLIGDKTFVCQRNHR